MKIRVDFKISLELNFNILKLTNWISYLYWNFFKQIRTLVCPDRLSRSHKILNSQFCNLIPKLRIDIDNFLVFLFSTSNSLHFCFLLVILIPLLRSNRSRLIPPSIYHSIPFPSFTSYPTVCTKTGPTLSPSFSKWRREKNARGITTFPSNAIHHPPRKSAIIIIPFFHRLPQFSPFRPLTRFNNIFDVILPPNFSFPPFFESLLFTFRSSIVSSTLSFLDEKFPSEIGN